MAPDLSGMSRSTNNAQSANTTSSSAQASPNLSRRTSSIMGPPPVPQNSSLPNSPRPQTAGMENSAFTATAGPIRHPRPLTAAELHLELEKEQESIVNRLTRELSALRAQTASVASTASSTSDLFTTQNDPYTYPYTAHNIIPTAARRHRSSSNLSSRSARSTRDALANTTGAGVTSVSGVAAPRDRDHGAHTSHTHSHQNSSRPSIDIPRPEMSRQNSTSGGFPAYRSSSNTAPPSATSPHWTSHGGSHPHPRHSVSSLPGTGGDVYSRSPSMSVGTSQAQARYEEAALQRAELDAVKRENEALRSRIKDLEKSLAEKSAARTAGTEPEAASGASVPVPVPARDRIGDGGADVTRQGA